MKNPVESLLEDDHESLGLLLTELDDRAAKRRQSLVRLSYSISFGLGWQSTFALRICICFLLLPMLPLRCSQGREICPPPKTLITFSCGCDLITTSS